MSKYIKQLVTDRNNTGKKIQQFFGKEWDHREKDTAKIVVDSYSAHKEEFKVLSVSSEYSPVWMTIQIEENKVFYKQSGKEAMAKKVIRTTGHSIEIDKKQLLQLIENLQQLATQIQE